MSLPYFKWFPAIAESDEKYRRYSVEELGFFHRCLNHQWTNCGIPSDPIERAEVLRLNRRVCDRLWKTVGKSFVSCERWPGRLVNPRLDKEWSELRLKSERNANAARSKSGKSEISLPRAYPSSSKEVFSVEGKEGVQGEPRTPNVERTLDVDPSLLDAFDQSIRVFVGPVDERKSREAFVKHVYTVERINAFLEHTPGWMQTKRYADGFHEFSAFVRSEVWLRPAPDPVEPKSRIDRLMDSV